MTPRSSAARAPERRHVEPARPTRPALRVIDTDELQKLKPARVGTIAGVVLFVALFALAAFQTVLINSQSRLDDLNQRVAEEQARQEQLELNLADLRSPERITAAARDRLGMIAPFNSTFLQPSSEDEDRARYVDPAQPPPTAPPAPPAPVDRR